MSPQTFVGVEAVSRSVVQVASVCSISILILFSIAASAAAQIDPFPVNAPVASYGEGGSGAGGIVPSLGSNGLPRVGNDRFEIVAEGVVGGSVGLLLYSTVGCDVPLPGIGRLYVQAGAIWPMPFVADGRSGEAGSGSASIPIALPNLPSFIGVSIHTQGFFFDAQASGGASHSQGLMLTASVAGESFPRSVASPQGLVFARVPAGSFVMGSPATEIGRLADEEQYAVSVTEPFYLQTTEVTQAQWVAVMGSNPSYGQGGDSSNRPVEYVSWEDVQLFIAALNELETEGRYRLPTEAEWEYACRAGSVAAFSFGVEPSDLGRFGWFVGNSARRTQDVGGKQPNAFGLYDMHGNVWEFCSDWYGAYPRDAVDDPQGPAAGPGRVIRGGSIDYLAEHCRSAVRRFQEPWDRSEVVGLRLVWERRVLPEMEFAWLPAGTFVMGDLSLPPEVFLHEERPHLVTLSKSFWMQTTEVTQAQWEAVMGENPSRFQGESLPVGEDSANRPVEQVSWDEVQVFIARLNALEPGANYRLPTEAEWEYACRAGSTTAFHFGDDVGDIAHYGWVGESPETGSTHVVASKAPNAWGLYDMHGNVAEWVHDWGPVVIYLSPVTDPQGNSSGAFHFYRGGGWPSHGLMSQSYNRGRFRFFIDFPRDFIGFRLVRSAP